MEMWQIFDDACAVELASGSLYANKVATAAMSSIANRAHEKRRAHDLGCKRLCSMGLLLCCCRPQEFVLVSSHNTTISPRVCLNVRDLVNCQPFVMSRSVHCSLYMLRMRKKEPPMDTRCEKDQAQNRTNYFSATSTVANRVTALAKNRVAGRFENGLSFLQRKGKGCLVGKQRIQWQNYFLPSEKGLRCGKQRHYLVI